MDPRQLLNRIEQLPAMRRLEAEDFIDFLASRGEERANVPPMTFSWAGGLAHLNAEYSSQTLKKQALDWMTHNGERPNAD